ncbi:MAG: hypothetical protein RL375_1740 [Pseudomonadota bacterium]|jgi:hypothetical protein
MTAPTPKRRGRPALPPGASTEAPVRTMRLSDAHWAELQARGGVQALRAWLSKPVRRSAA